ncbi:SDR family oxidoreductase [Streptomyces vietnamensis]|uniref:SDR family oxidoreductase n=1 Tax=Streptomyces vietnamensis TaxID=362257 RepID=UPI0037B5034F
MLPGNVRTEDLDALGEDHLRRMAASIPLGRPGETSDIAHAVGFLASDEAAFVTGQTPTVDGGQTVPESLDALAPASSVSGRRRPGRDASLTRRVPAWHRTVGCSGTRPAWGSSSVTVQGLDGVRERSDPFVEQSTEEWDTGGTDQDFPRERGLSPGG